MTKHLWAPWRIEYILGPKSECCVFCDEDKRSDEERLILKRGKHSFVIMNFYPYNNGHLMVCPYKHTNDYEALDINTKIEMQELISESIAVLKKIMHPEGFNIGMNLGRTAGAGIDKHLHWHIVPRWNGDTNFMPVTNHTRVLAEALEETWKKLKTEF
jgi:ATP adenylyltransferase